MRISVIIRTYSEERWGHLADAVASLWVQTRPPDEVVLVVDHNPALLDRARRAFPAVRVVPSATRGSSGAWNSGIAHAAGDVLAFMDDDAAAEPDWLARLAAPYDDEAVAGVGGAIEPQWLDGRPAWFPAEFQWVVGCTYRGAPEALAPVRNLIGCNMSFRRSALEALGGFQEIDGLGHMGAVPVGCDETELCIRLRQRSPGAVLLHEPGAVVRHKVPARRAAFRYFLSRCLLEGRSKAVVSRLVGARDGLSTERRHALRVLPSGVARGMRDALRGDPAGVLRSGAIVLGLSATATSYLGERLRLAAAARSARAPAPA